MTSALQDTDTTRLGRGVAPGLAAHPRQGRDLPAVPRPRCVRRARLCSRAPPSARSTCSTTSGTPTIPGISCSRSSGCGRARRARAAAARRQQHHGLDPTSRRSTRTRTSRCACSTRCVHRTAPGGLRDRFPAAESPHAQQVVHRRQAGDHRRRPQHRRRVFRRRPRGGLRGPGRHRRGAGADEVSKAFDLYWNSASAYPRREDPGTGRPWNGGAAQGDASRRRAPTRNRRSISSDARDPARDRPARGQA